MQIILVEDGGAHRCDYVAAVGRALDVCWREQGHTVLRARRETLDPPDAGEHARPSDMCDAALRLLRRYPGARVHLLSTGPLAWAVATACGQQRRPFTSTSVPASLQTHEQRAFQHAVADIHAGAVRVVTPAPAAGALLDEAGIRSAAVVTAGVDARTFQPRVYAYLELPRPISLLLGAGLSSPELREFLATPLPGSRLAYAPEWTGGESGEPVRMLGYLPPVELAQLISAADVCVIPGEGPEAILKALQALACGVPIASRWNPYLEGVLRGEPVGVADEDIGRAVTAALGANRQVCRRVALRYTWRIAADRILAIRAAAPGDTGYPDREVA